jgi:hypothetical protein
MNRRKRVLFGTLAALSALFAITTAFRIFGPHDGKIDNETVEAYAKLGGEYGGWHSFPEGLWFDPGREGNVISGFRFRSFPNSKLPEVPYPFKLDLRGSDVTDAGIGELRHLQNLVWLDLCRTKVTHAGVKELAPLKKLKTLEIDTELMTDETLRTLRSIDLLHALCRARGKHDARPFSAEAVIALDLYHTPVTDKGLNELVVLKNLQVLHLWDTKTTDAGIANFRNQMPRCRILRSSEDR